MSPSTLPCPPLESSAPSSPSWPIGLHQEYSSSRRIPSRHPVANFAKPASLRSQGFSLRQVSKLTSLHRENHLSHTGSGVLSRSEVMRLPHARRKGNPVDAGPFHLRPTSINPKNKVQELFQANLPLVTSEASRAFRKISPLYDLKTLEHFGSIGLWDACRRFTGDEPSFQFYARVRIRGQIWDEIRVESDITRRMLKSDAKPTLINVDSVVLESPKPNPEHLTHLRDILQQVDSTPFTDRERQIIDALASGQSLSDLALAWGVSLPLVSQIKTRALLKIATLAHKADLNS